jgi:threonine aldolase
VIAAPALLALRTHRERLVEDHARARRLAEGLAAAGAELLFAPVETNLVFVRTPGHPVSAVKDALARRGVLVGLSGPDTLRFATHLDVDDADVERALAAFREALAPARS